MWRKKCERLGIRVTWYISQTCCCDKSAYTSLSCSLKAVRIKAHSRAMTARSCKRQLTWSPSRNLTVWETYTATYLHRAHATSNWWDSRFQSKKQTCMLRRCQCQCALVCFWRCQRCMTLPGSRSLSSAAVFAARMLRMSSRSLIDMAGMSLQGAKGQQGDVKLMVLQ